MCSMAGPSPVRRSDALPADYPQFLAEIKARIAGARTRAVLAVNGELIRQFPEMTGLSLRNLRYMRADSELARDAIKDPYNLEFLGMSIGLQR